MNLRQTVSLKPLSVEEIAALVDAILLESDPDSKTHAQLAELSYDLALQLSRERIAQNQTRPRRK